MKGRQRLARGKVDRGPAQQAAAELAGAALNFLAAEPERIERFLALSGIDPGSIRAVSDAPDFLVGVLDHLLADETLLLAFAEQNDIDPEDVGRARETLDPHPGDTGAA